MSRKRNRVCRLDSASYLHHDLARAVLDLLVQEGAEPGTPLRQDALAAKLGVSRTPIRGALAVLATAGSVEARGRTLVLRDPNAAIPAAPAEAPVAALMVALSRDRAAGRLPDSMTEAELQRHSGAARGDLARALRRLEELGIVSRNRGHGWRFNPSLATPAERDAAYRFRIVMEPAALMEPGYALPEGFAAKMREGHRVFLEQPWQDSRAVEFFELNAAFHRGIVAASANRFFLAAAEQHNQLRRLTNYGWVLGAQRVHQNAEEHLLILDALEAGEQEHAAALLAEHLRAAQALGAQLARLRGAP